MLTESEAFHEARRIASETGQAMFVFFTTRHHRDSNGVIQPATRQYDVGIAIPCHGVQVGDRVGLPAVAGHPVSRWDDMS